MSHTKPLNVGEEIAALKARVTALEQKQPTPQNSGGNGDPPPPPPPPRD